jgi:AcrR family transcriptional regulator
MADESLSRKERERRAHRAEILQAAERVFGRDGFHRATVEQVAQEADFAVGTLYNFFDSKEQLFHEVVTKLVNETYNVLEERVFSEDDPVAAVEALIDVRLRFPEEHEGFSRVFVDAVGPTPARFPGALPPDAQDLYRRYLAAVTDVIRRGIDAGVFRNVDPRSAALCLEGAFQIVGTHWIVHEPDGPIENRIREVRRILMSMLRLAEDHDRNGGHE